MAIVYLHVGPYKTGSTAIQEFLFARAGELLNEGFYLPECGRKDLSSPHHNLAWDAGRDERFDPALGGWDALLRVLEGKQKVLVSSEAFSSFPNQYAEVFRQLDAAGHSLRTLFVVRSPIEIINSAYTQRVKTLRLSLSFDEYFPRAMKEKRYDYLRFYREFFRDHYGPVLLPYRRDNLIDTFLSAIGSELRVGDSGYNSLANASPLAHEVEAIRLSSEFLRSSGISTEKMLEILRAMRSDYPWSEAFWGFSEAQFMAAAAKFNAGLDELFRENGGNPGAIAVNNRKRTAFMLEYASQGETALFGEYCSIFWREVAKIRRIPSHRLPASIP